MPVMGPYRKMLASKALSLGRMIVREPSGAVSGLFNPARGTARAFVAPARPKRATWHLTDLEPRWFISGSGLALTGRYVTLTSLSTSRQPFSRAKNVANWPRQERSRPRSGTRVLSSLTVSV